MTKTIKKTDAIRNVKTYEMQRAEFARPDYRVIITDLATTREDVLKPEFWVHVGQTFKQDKHPFAHVELIWQDGSKWMEVVVLSAGKLWAKVGEKKYLEFGETEEEREDFEINPDFSVRFVPALKWCVYRDSDKERMAENLKEKTEAHIWIQNHVRSLR